jgi:ribose transport system permease protein
MSDNVPTSTERPAQPADPAAGVDDAAAASGHAAAPTEPRSAKFASYASRYGLLGAFLLSILIFSLVRSESFPTGRNAESILTNAAPSLIIAVGLTVVLVMQDFDLSFGAMIGLGGGAAEAFMVDAGWPWQVAIVAILGLGIVAGVLNGFMVAYLGGSSFIITLAMGTVLTGVEFALTNQNTVYQGFPQTFVDIASNEFLGLSNQIWIAAVIAIVIWVLLDRTEIGRYMYAIGGNPEAARLSGVRIRSYTTVALVLSATIAGGAGIMFASLNGPSLNFGGTLLLPAFAAAFLGSTQLIPGRFNVWGTLLAIFVLATGVQGLQLVSGASWLNDMFNGVALIIAVALSIQRSPSARWHRLKARFRRGSTGEDGSDGSGGSDVDVPPQPEPAPTTTAVPH